MIRTVLASALALALAACGKAAPESDDPLPGAAPDSAATAAVSPASFAQCRTCHQVAPGRHGVGPSLAGVYGRKSAVAQDYNYSSAMKAAGLTWDDATLSDYLEAPTTAVPGTKMVYPGLKDPAKRAEVIAYLKTI